MINRTALSIIILLNIFVSTDLKSEEEQISDSIVALKQEAQSISKKNYSDFQKYQNIYEKNLFNERVKSEVTQSVINILEWNNWVLEHNKEVYRQHAAESRYIFWMVFALAGFSMFMVAWQFFIYSQKIKIINKSEASTKAELGLTSGVFSVSKNGISIDTPFIGAIILVITFFFLNSYLTNVYPIHKKDQTVLKSEENI